MSLRIHAVLSRLAVALLVFLAPGHCPAVLLDWNPQSWSGGNLSRSFELDGTNPGNDVTITITGNTSYFQDNTPNDTSDLTGGQGGSQQSLFLSMDWSSRNQSVTVTIDFHYADGVDNVAFTIFDVDYGSGSYRDKVSGIVGTDELGGLVTPTLTASSGNQLVGSGTNQYVRGTASIDSDENDANVGVAFASTIYTAQFTYGNETNAPSNPGIQWIGLYDISFTKAPPKIPEVHPAWASSLACFLVMGVRCLRARLRGTGPATGLKIPVSAA